MNEQSEYRFVIDACSPETLPMARLAEYLDELRAAPFTRDVSSKGVQAWAVRHEVAVEHQEGLTDPLRRIIKGLE